MSSSPERGRRQRPTIRLEPEDNPEIVLMGQGSPPEGVGGPPEGLPPPLPPQATNPNRPPHKPLNRREKRFMFVGDSIDENAVLRPDLDFDDPGAEQ